MLVMLDPVWKYGVGWKAGCFPYSCSVIFFLSFINVCLSVKSFFGPYDHLYEYLCLSVPHLLIRRCILTHRYTHACTKLHKHSHRCMRSLFLVSENALTHIFHDNKDVELIHANSARCKAKKCYATREISFQIAAASTSQIWEGKLHLCTCLLKEDGCVITSVMEIALCVMDNWIPITSNRFMYKHGWISIKLTNRLLNYWFTVYINSQKYCMRNFLRNLLQMKTYSLINTQGPYS